MRTRATTYIACSVILCACGGGMTISGENTAARTPSLRDVTPAQWEALAGRRILFGHQSVGGNIMDGIADVLRDNPHIRLNVQETRELVDGAAPGFFHTAIGRNDFPMEKFDDFLTLASGGFGSDGGIAMMKLCYVDIHRDTDAETLFREYQQRVRTLRSRNPALTIVHVTAPLTNIENWKGRLRATLSGSATQRQRNVVRHRYNELMRSAYLGREPLFDLARLESTLPNGAQVLFGGDSRVQMLAPEYTDDGGHLNATARRYVAEQLLIMLAQLAADSPGTARQISSSR